MPTNFSLNKVRVTRLFKSGADVGLIDPKVGLVTDYGTITALASGNYTVTVSGTPGVFQTRYPHELCTLASHASGVHAWPSGDGGVVWGHNGVWPSGVATAAGSGMVYLKGGTPVTFYR